MSRAYINIKGVNGSADLWEYIRLPRDYLERNKKRGPRKDLEKRPIFRVSCIKTNSQGRVGRT